MATRSLTPLVTQIRQMVGASALPTPTDRELLERFAASKEPATFEALVRRHGKLVLSACRQVLSDPADVDDAFQATFLTLLLRAESVRWQPSIGNWLFGAAHRIAVQARASAARRRQREARAAAAKERSSEPPDLSWREAVGLLHEELDRLPDRYRLPLLLCYLQGKSRDEAAEQLGITPGAVKWRLERGREALRKRLVRRGITFGATLVGALGNSSAVGALPPRLVQATLQAATAGDVPAAVAALTTGVSAVLGSKIKLTAALVLCVAMMTGIAAHRALAPLSASPPGEASRFAYAPAAEPTQPVPAPPPDSDEADKTISVRGRVLDPDGKPVQRAKVLLVRNHWDFNEMPADHRAGEGTTDAKGRFRFTVARADLGDPARSGTGGGYVHHILIAVKEGFGPGWVSVRKPEEAANATVKLVKDDVPIEGRVLDLEGKPIRGVQVRVRRIATSNGDDVGEWAEKLKRGVWSYPGVLLTAVAPPPVATDRDGRFRLSGIGCGRLVLLRFKGPTIETRDVYTMTLKRPTMRIPRGEAYDGGLLHGAKFDHVAAPTRPVVGTVRDKDTDKPVAGVVLRARIPSGPLWPSVRQYVSAATDENGRYRLDGLSREAGQRIYVHSSPGLPYLPSVAKTEAAEGLRPARLDFELKRGVLIRGKVTDKTTGKPVQGAEVIYLTFADNPHLKDAPEFQRSRLPKTFSRRDGTFTFVALRGRGIVAAKVEPGSPYLAGVGADQVKGQARRDARGGIIRFVTVPYMVRPLLWNTLVEVKPAKDAKSITCDVVLDPGKTVTGRIVGPDGKPVEGVEIQGSWGLNSGRQGPFPTERFTLLGVNPKAPRPFFFHQREKQLAAAVLPKGDEPKDFVVKLQRCATVTGRLLDANGKPLAEKYLSGYIEEGQLNLTEGWHGFFGVRTDKDGRFRIEGLIPGVTVSARLMDQNMGGRVFEKLSLRPGEVKDLGDVTINVQSEGR